jgi:hypothetical protein
MLDRVDVADLALDIREVAEQLCERLGRLDRVLGVLFEEDEKLTLFGQKR